MQAAASIAMIMMMCDRDLKENVEAIDADEILKKLETLDISKWNYKGDDQKHVGPMAQDFAERFGGPDRYIYVTDAFGVLTAALKALAGRVRELEAAQ